MTAIGRIPFSLGDNAVLRSLGNWMLALAVLHGLGALGMLAIGGFAEHRVLTADVSALARALGGVHGVVLLAIGLTLIAEAALLTMARSALHDVITSESGQQGHVATAIRRLKLFFLVELGGFGLSAVAITLAIAIQLAAPDLWGSSSSGRSVVEGIRSLRGR